jgi:hypothetical protein
VCATELICLAVSQSCGLAQPEGASCTTTSDCQDGLFCNTALAEPVCSGPGGAGTACGEDSQCLTGLTCNKGYDPGLCEEPRAGAAGTPCSGDAHCGTGLLCYHTSHCEAVGDNGATYYTSPSTCTAAGTIESGAPCQQDANCVSRRCLETKTGICINHVCE